LLLLLAKILLRKTEISSRFLTLWWTCGTWVPHNFRAFYHTHPCLSTVKNTYNCYHGSLLSAEKKTRMSLSQIQLIWESLEVEKPGFFHVRSLHCCRTLLKIIKHNFIS
jgi:hypothetical protein